MDKAWKGLFYKEWKMMKGFLIGMYVLAVIFFIFVSYHSNVMQALSGLLFMGIIILPLTLIYSLNTEVNQMQSFLYNPHSAHKLFLTKLLYSFIVSIVFMFLITLIITGLEMIGDYFSLTVLELFTFYFFQSIVILMISLFFGVLCLLIWTIHQIWKRYIGMLSIVLLITVWVLISKPLELLFQSNIYKSMTDWGYVSINPFAGSRMHPNDFLYLANDFHLGTFVFYGVTGLIFYFLSVSLLERKVEV